MNPERKLYGLFLSSSVREILMPLTSLKIALHVENHESPSDSAAQLEAKLETFIDAFNQFRQRYYAMFNAATDAEADRIYLASKADLHILCADTLKFINDMQTALPSETISKYIALPKLVLQDVLGEAH